MIKGFTVVDTHTHTYPTLEKANKIINAFTIAHDMQPIAVSEGTINDLYRQMESYGIDYSVLANFAPKNVLHQNNLWTLSTAKENSKFIPYISVHPEMDCDILELIENYFRLNAKGFKIHPNVQTFDIKHNVLKPVWELCDKQKIPVLVHCGPVSTVCTNEYANFNVIEPFIGNYQSIPIILAHLGGGEPDYVFRIAEKYPNIYFDTAITFSGKHCIKRIHDELWENDEKVVWVFRKIGIEKIIFGSDYPYGSPIDDVNRIIRLDLTDCEKRAILGKNALELYNIKI